jgi:hypothetical protein
LIAAAATHVSSHATIALVVAIVGLALAVASLAWQAATFVLSGSRVRVELLPGATGRGMLITHTAETWTPANISMLAKQGMTEEVLAVEARNVGRMAATIQKMQAKLANGVGLEPTTHPHAPLPFRLEAGSSEKWWVQAADVRTAIAASGLASSKVHIEVSLGTGKIRRTTRMTVSR